MHSEKVLLPQINQINLILPRYATGKPDQDYSSWRFPSQEIPHHIKLIRKQAISGSKPEIPSICDTYLSCLQHIKKIKFEFLSNPSATQI